MPFSTNYALQLLTMSLLHINSLAVHKELEVETAN